MFFSFFGGKNTDARDYLFLRIHNTYRDAHDNEQLESRIYVTHMVTHSVVVAVISLIFGIVSILVSLVSFFFHNKKFKDYWIKTFFI